MGWAVKVGVAAVGEGEQSTAEHLDTELDALMAQRPGHQRELPPIRSSEAIAVVCSDEPGVPFL